MYTYLNGIELNRELIFDTESVQNCATRIMVFHLKKTTKDMKTVEKFRFGNFVKLGKRNSEICCDK